MNKLKKMGYRAIAVDFRGERPRVIQWEKIAKEAPPERARNEDDSRPARGALAAAGSGPCPAPVAPRLSQPGAAPGAAPGPPESGGHEKKRGKS